MEVTGKDNSSYIPGILHPPSAFKVVDEHVDQEKIKIILSFTIFPNNLPDPKTSSSQ